MNEEVYELIKNLADKYAEELKQQVVARVDEMKNDDNSHFLVYRVLGVSDEEGNLIHNNPICTYEDLDNSKTIKTPVFNIHNSLQFYITYTEHIFIYDL